MHAEYLNASSANAMLKFLEEPEEHIIGFFLTNNKENVINTIKSRCQILTDFAFNNVEEANEELYQDAIAFIKEYEITHEDTIFYCKNNMSTLIKDRSNFILFFQSVYSIYELLYFVKLGICSLDEKNLDLAFLLEKEVLIIFIVRLIIYKSFLLICNTMLICNLF